jgi:hypothetical protein
LVRLRVGVGFEAGRAHVEVYSASGKPRWSTLRNGAVEVMHPALTTHGPIWFEEQAGALIGASDDGRVAPLCGLDALHVSLVAVLDGTLLAFIIDKDGASQSLVRIAVPGVAPTRRGWPLADGGSPAHDYAVKR